MNDSDRLRQEAEDAERRYNEALTAVDHAFIPADETPGPVVPWPDAVLPPPAGPHKPWLRIIHRWLAPVFARQRTFDNHVVDAIDALTDQEGEVAFARFETALIIFLQKITAFVESKDRLVTATAASRLDRHDELLGRLPEMQTQLAVLQRATQMLKIGFADPTTRFARSCARMCRCLPAQATCWTSAAGAANFSRC